MNKMDEILSGLFNDDYIGSLRAEELVEFVTGVQIVYGIKNDPELVPRLTSLYQTFMELIEAERRRAVGQRVARAMKDKMTSMNALIPFLLVDEDRGVVSTATIDLAMIGYPSDSDPLGWPRWLVDQVKMRVPANVGAMFGGLVSLGDARVNSLLMEARTSLSSEEVGEAARCVTGFGQIGTVEFWLDWLEECSGTQDDAIWRNAASALVNLVNSLQSPYFLDAERNFGYPWNEGCEPMEVYGQMSVVEVAERYSSRMYALEASEPPPKVMSKVLESYGLPPRANPDDQAVPC